MTFGYLFGVHVGYDSVAIVNSNLLLEEGDLVVWEKEGKKGIVLILGKSVSFIERYTRNRNLPSENVSVYKNFLAPTTLRIIHWMVSEWYTTYHKVVSLYFPKKRKEYIHVYTKNATPNPNYDQYLFLFPDLWTLRNTIPKEELESKDNVILTSNVSLNARIAAANSIRRSEVKNVYVTKGEVFQDWRNLKQITIFDHHKRYYESQQDPRYKIADVVKKMSEVYAIPVIYK